MRTAALWDELTNEDLFADPFADPLGDPLVFSPGGGSPPTGTPFLVDVLDPNAQIIVEAAFGANIKGNPNTWNWFGITANVRQADGQLIAISPLGRSDETSQSQPAGCSFQLDNTIGDYTANHPNSKWWPFVRRNTPIRVRLYINGSMTLRFQGYANGWVPSWDTSCNLAVVTVSASGILRRLNQGKTPLRSAIFRSLSVAAPPPSLWWQMSDGTKSTQAASALLGGAPFAFPTVVTFGTDAPAGADGSVDITNLLVSPLTNPVISSINPGGVGDSFAVAIWVKGTQTGAGWFAPVISIQTDSAVTPAWSMEIADPSGGGGMSLMAENPDGTLNTEFILSHTNTLTDNAWHLCFATVTQTSATAVHVTGGVDNQTPFSYNLSTFGLGKITGVRIGPTPFITAANKVSKLLVSNVAVWGATAILPPNLYQAGIAYSGESPTDRLLRLCVEEGIGIDITGTSTTTMGPQSVATLVGLLRECETADDGLLYDGLGPGLGYVSRSARYNATASISPDMAAAPPQVDDPFDPADDDQRNRNIIKVDRTNGSSATFVDSTGPLGTSQIQDYDSSVTVNTQTDGVLLDRAAWEVHKGTMVGFRYPQLNLNLHAAPVLAPAWLAMRLAGRADVLNVASKATQHPPGTVSLLLEGYGESLGPFDWQVTGNCSPYDPWNVAVVGSTFRLEFTGTTLATAEVALASGTPDTWLVSTATLPLLTTTHDYPADFPYDINCDGEQVTVTAGATAFNQNPWFETDVSDWTASSAALTRSTVQAHQGAASMLITPTGGIALVGGLTGNAMAIAGTSYTMSFWAFSPLGWTTLGPGIEWLDAGGSLLSSSFPSSAAIPAATWTFFTQTNTAPPGTAQMQGRIRMGGTPAATDLLYVDEAMLTSSPMQMLTVTRGVNGVVKPHYPGAVVSLWKPASLAL